MADTYSVERSATVPGSPQAVFDLLTDFHRWTEWSPWEDVDPNLQRRFSGAASGVGAVYEWSGNKKAGQGRMEVTEATPASKVAIKLDFLKPFKSSNVTTFTLTPEGAGTHVRWQMTGPRPLIMRIFGFAFNMDKLVGKDFEKGLDNLARATG
ncbi:MAG TPA: SRPBCC family protein [Nocardioidaceae bacterium]|nr:SRPBCC family protein [Nocardioidaceae bacterium]